MSENIGTLRYTAEKKRATVAFAALKSSRVELTYNGKSGLWQFLLSHSGYLNFFYGNVYFI